MAYWVNVYEFQCVCSSADLRAHMASEAHRADSAEAAATQALARCAQLEKAAAAAAAGQSAAEVRMAEALATLQEKREQVSATWGLIPCMMLG